MPVSRKLVYAVYAAIAIAALIVTWSQNLAYVDHMASFVTDFFADTKVTPASRSITVDIFLFSLAASILMVIEARKHGVRFVWAYIIGSMFTAISVTFPLFLIARELRLAETDATRLKVVDVILLAVVAVGTVGVVVYFDVF